MEGRLISHYQIKEQLGRGGMGVVYRAHDTKLNREVALKVLPSAALATEDDRARFYREAQAAAQLHHPNIATIFEIDEAVPSDAPHDTQPSPFIVMELVEGETLCDRIQKAPLKISEAVRIANEVAQALKMAHSKDIVHRDIKSANIMLDSEGRAKVLDFGLAKTAQSTQLTRMGSALGTVTYMSPEQARAEEVDLRTDIWALGVVLYEMVTGSNPFAGEYEQAIVYTILNEDPEPLTALRTGVPLAVESIVEKCLRKEAKHRYQSAAGMIADLEAVKSGSGSRPQTRVRTGSIAAASTRSQRTSASRFPVIWMIALVAVAIAAALVGRMTTPAPDAPLTEFLLHEWPIKTGYNLSNSQISPNGEYVALPLDGQIFLRQLSSVEMRAIPGAEGGQAFFWSPDSRHLGFHRDGSIWKVDINGGLPEQLATLPPTGFAWSGTWTEEGMIYANTARGPGNGIIYRLPDRGGAVERVIPSDTLLQSGAMLSPEAIAGSGDITFLWIGENDINNFGTYRLSGKDATLLSEEIPMLVGIYDPEGYMLYGLRDGIWAVPYDEKRTRTTGIPKRLFRDVAPVSVSHKNSLVYTRENPGYSLFGWVDSEGREMSENGTSRALSQAPRMSPDGSFYVFKARPEIGDVSSPEVTNSQLFIHRVEEGTEQVIRELEGELLDFSVSPDSRQIAVSYDWDIWLLDVDGKRFEPLEEAGGSLMDPNWTPDGKVIYVNSDAGLGDLWIRDPHPDSTARPLVTSPKYLSSPKVSSDGRVLSYLEVGDVSDWSSIELVVRDYQDLSKPIRTLGTGFSPRWSGDGTRLYWISVDGQMMQWIVPPDLSGSLGAPVPLFSVGELGLVQEPYYDVDPNSDRFLMNFKKSESTRSAILVQNWKRLLDE